MLSFTAESQTIAVPVVRADELVNNVLHNSAGRSRLMKNDGEGAEMDVLKGMSNALKSSLVEYIYVGIHPLRLASQRQEPKDVCAMIEDHAYKRIQRFREWSYLYRCARSSEANSEGY